MIVHMYLYKIERDCMGEYKKYKYKNIGFKKFFRQFRHRALPLFKLYPNPLWVFMQSESIFFLIFLI